MAYFDMERYAEAEPWLLKARAADKTVTASDYNLGRIAFETKRYRDAAASFERVLKKDPDNIQALQAAAYTYIKAGDLEKAEERYRRVLELVPDSADSGYNYALVLYVMEKYAESEEALAAYPASLKDNKDALLLYARAQKAQHKVEAVDSYAEWLAANEDAKVRYEYASCLEAAALYSRAIEEYRAACEKLAADSQSPTKPEARFALARTLLIADSENDEGLTELEGALMDGFADFDAVALLLTEDSISETRKADIQRLIDNPPKPEAPPAEETPPPADEDGADNAPADKPDEAAAPSDSVGG
jgi:tetratricopeptide (TPR) repeat protein